MAITNSKRKKRGGATFERFLDFLSQIFITSDPNNIYIKKKQIFCDAEVCFLANGIALHLVFSFTPLKMHIFKNLKTGLSIISFGLFNERFSIAP